MTDALPGLRLELTGNLRRIPETVHGAGWHGDDVAGRLDATKGRREILAGLSDSLMRVDELFETRAYKQYSQVFLDVVVISPADLRKALGIASIAGAEKANRRRMDPELRAMTEQDRFEAVMFARGCGMLCRNLQDGYVHSSDQLMWATWKAAVETERAR